MESFQQQAFCFSMPTEDFDPKQIPQDGEQYLQSVIYERNNCPAVVKKAFKKKKTEKATQASGSKKSPLIWERYDKTDLNDETAAPLLPTAEWVKRQSDEFQKLHDRITSIREHFQPDYENVDLPACNTDENWLEHCRGKEPLLQNMLHINQRDLEQVIEFQSNWLIDDIDWYLNNKLWFPQWVYSSLACLRLPCEPNLLNSLRQIAKTCHRLRSKLNAEEDNDTVIPLNLIICIVSRNFYQSDLTGRIK